MRQTKDWRGARVVEAPAVGQKAPMSEPTTLPLLSLSSLCVARGDALVIDSLTLTVQPGEALHVRGENGAGKSTLLLALAGLIPIASGTVDRQTDAGLGFLGHDNGLLPDLTVAQNLDAYSGSGLQPDPATAEALGVPALLTQPVRTLSFGQARRVALSLTCLREAGLWLLDEPFAGLDQGTVTVLEGVMERFLRERRGGLVFTSHDRQLPGARTLDLGAGAAHV